MNISIFRFCTILVMLSAVGLPQTTFSQEFELQWQTKKVLKNSDYFDDTQPYQITNNRIIYSKNEKDSIKFYLQNNFSDSCLLAVKKTKGHYYKSFKFTDDLKTAYLLYHEKLISIPVDSVHKSISAATSTLTLEQPYDDLYISDDKVVLTRTYNEAVSPGEWPKFRVLILNPENLDVIQKKDIAHDAIGLTHKPTFYADVNYGKVLVVNALSLTFSVIELKDPVQKTYGDPTLLNEGIDSLPFDTRIMKYTNAKSKVVEIIDFAKKIDFIEGGVFCNDSTLMIVEKTKGNDASARKLHFFVLNKASNSWEFNKTKSFKAKKRSKEHIPFQFYYPNRFQIVDDYVFMIEMDNPFKSMKRLKKAIENPDQQINFAVYEFKLVY